MKKIQDTDIYKLNYFTYNKAFSGSIETMRYRIICEPPYNSRQKLEEQPELHLLAAVYPQPYCWEETAEDKKEYKKFAFSEEGRQEMIDWLNEKLEQ